MLNTILKLTTVADSIELDNLSYEYYDSKLKTNVKVSLFKELNEWQITTTYESKDNVGIWTEYKKIYEIIDNELVKIDTKCNRL